MYVYTITPREQRQPKNWAVRDDTEGRAALKFISSRKKAPLLVLGGALTVMLSACRTHAPKITPTAGTYTCPQSVTITDLNGLASIYYTTDGTTPTTTSIKYAGPFSIDSTGTVRAIAVAPGANPSKVVRSAYICSTTTLTRGDFAVLVQQTFNLPQPNNPPMFPDVPPNAPIYGAVEAVAPFMNPMLLCPGCQLNANFFPNEPISRAISTITLVRILENAGKLQLLNAADSQAVLSSVPDARTLPLAARPCFATAIKSGILPLNAGNTIQADQPHTRPEIVALLVNIRKQFNIVVKPAQ